MKENSKETELSDIDPKYFIMNVQTPISSKHNFLSLYKEIQT